MLSFVANEIRNSPIQATAAALFLLGLAASAAASIWGFDWQSLAGLRLPASPIAVALLLGTGLGLVASLLFRIGATIGSIASFAAVFAIVEMAASMASAHAVLQDTSGIFVVAACAYFPFYGLYMQAANAKLDGKDRSAAGLFMMIIAVVAFSVLLPMRLSMYLGP